MPTKVEVKLRSSRWAGKRSDIDIMANILNEAHMSARKTRIMYRCNLSHRQLATYLELLLDMEFLIIHSEKDSSNLDFFKTTTKGLKFLDAYRTLKALMT